MGSHQCILGTGQLVHLHSVSQSHDHNLQYFFLPVSGICIQFLAKKKSHWEKCIGLKTAAKNVKKNGSNDVMSQCTTIGLLKKKSLLRMTIMTACSHPHSVASVFFLLEIEVYTEISFLYKSIIDPSSLVSLPEAISFGDMNLWNCFRIQLGSLEVHFLFCFVEEGD